MHLKFSLKVFLVGFALIALFLRLSYWQWERNLQKQNYIKIMDARLAAPIENLENFVINKNTDWAEVIHRRVNVKGTFDFEHEMVLRNRMYEKSPGFHVITPLKIDNTQGYILVDRGFIPFSKGSPEDRKAFQDKAHANFVGLVKESTTKKIFAPNDPESGPGHWVDAWLRVDVPNIAKQLPYTLLPVFLEIMGETEAEVTSKNLVKDSTGREEMFIPLKGDLVQGPDTEPNAKYPIPSPDTVVPPGRHLGYVWEWGFMAFMTFVICLILQLRRVG